MPVASAVATVADTTITTINLLGVAATGENGETKSQKRKTGNFIFAGSYESPFLFLKPHYSACPGALFVSGLVPLWVQVVLNPGSGIPEEKWETYHQFSNTSNYVLFLLFSSYNSLFRILKEILHELCLGFIAAFSGRNRLRCAHSYLS